MDEWKLFALGAGGAASLEVVKVYAIKHRLHLKKYQKIIRSPLFWATVIAMLLVSGFIAWAAHSGVEQVQNWHVVVTGVAARSVIRQLGESTPDGLKLGDDESVPKIRQMFP